jgi:hypothetical protein
MTRTNNATNKKNRLDIRSDLEIYIRMTIEWLKNRGRTPGEENSQFTVAYYQKPHLGICLFGF